MAKPPHTSVAMRVFYPVFKWRELAAGWRYTTRKCMTITIRALSTIKFIGLLETNTIG
jgi:hypothetical protein